MQHVLSTLPVSISHFIRCIQTSPTHNTPAQFNRAHVSQQISNLVVLETVDMLSNNYCYRYTFDEFLRRCLVDCSDVLVTIDIVYLVTIDTDHY